jgi:hypothetical protein
VLVPIATLIVSSDPTWVRVLIPLGAAILGAVIGSATLIWLERRRDYRISRSAAIVLHETLYDIISMQNIALFYPSAPILIPTERFISTWHEHKAALALSISPAEWRIVSSPFSRLDSLLGASKVLKRDSEPLPPFWKSTYIPDSTRSARQAMATLSSRFSLPEIHVPESINEVIEYFSTEDPEVAAMLTSFVDSLSGDVPDAGRTPEPDEG